MTVPRTRAKELSTSMVIFQLIPIQMNTCTNRPKNRSYFTKIHMSDMSNIFQDAFVKVLSRLKLKQTLHNYNKLCCFLFTHRHLVVEQETTLTLHEKKLLWPVKANSLSYIPSQTIAV